MPRTSDRFLNKLFFLFLRQVNSGTSGRDEKNGRGAIQVRETNCISSFFSYYAMITRRTKTADKAHPPVAHFEWVVNKQKSSIFRWLFGRHSVYTLSIFFGLVNRSTFSSKISSSFLPISHQIRFAWWYGAAKTHSSVVIVVPPCPLNSCNKPSLTLVKEFHLASKDYGPAIFL